jgi:orotate phosphoribosyltransferase-like protein
LTLNTPLKRMNRITRLAAAGMSDARIANKLGVAREAVSWCRLCLGIPAGMKNMSAARRKAQGPKKIAIDYERLLDAR